MTSMTSIWSLERISDLRQKKYILQSTMETIIWEKQKADWNWFWVIIWWQKLLINKDL